MGYLIIFLILILINLAYVYNINISKLKKFAENEEKKLNSITDIFPANIEICKAFLKRINNNTVQIEEEKNYQSCLYIAITNKIIIADVKNSYTRIQTIAHECLHSIQDRKIQLFNFIFSNIYLIYFILVTILGIFNIIQNTWMFISIMLAFSYTYYFIRSYLEMDAMIKAKYLAKEYMEEMNLTSKDKIDKIIKSYEDLNNMGIKVTNYELMLETIVKTIIMAIAFLI